MERLNKDQVNQKKLVYANKLKPAVFIYPTDTIYGIGCDATNPELVERIRILKDSETQPFSVIAPSLDWIKENCELNKHAKEWLKKLPGPYTLIIKLKNLNCVASNVLQGKTTIGIRIPDNWFTEIVKEMEVPIVTTSANKTGQNFMTRMEDLDEKIVKNVDYVVYDGIISGRPSTLVIIDHEVEIKKR